MVAAWNLLGSLLNVATKLGNLHGKYSTVELSVNLAQKYIFFRTL